MAWGLTAAGLVEQRDAAAAKAERRGSHLAYEGLARGHRWLDEDAAARGWFAAAVADADERIERRGRGGATSRGRMGVLSWLAGDEPASRDWLERAVAETLAGDRLTTGAQAEVAQWRCLLGDGAGCEATWEAMGRPAEYELTAAAATLARAARTHDPDPLEALRTALARGIRADRLSPAETSGAAAGSPYEWLEEAFRLEAELRGEPIPDHLAMLERSGLLTGGRPAPSARAMPPPGRWSLPLQAPDGSTLDPVLTAEADSAEALLDPRAGTELKVILTTQFGEVRTQVEWGDDEDGWVEERLGPFATFDEAEAATVDWLRAYAPDPPGGAWAADAFAALLGASRG